MKEENDDVPLAFDMFIIILRIVLFAIGAAILISVLGEPVGIAVFLALLIVAREKMIIKKYRKEYEELKENIQTLKQFSTNIHE